jgi:ribosomal protein S6
MYMDQQLYITPSRDNLSVKVMCGVVAAAVVGFVVYVGASTPSSSSLYAAPSAVQSTTSMAPAVARVGAVQPAVQPAAAYQTIEAFDNLDDTVAPEMASLPASNGLATPLALTGLSAIFLGLASWVLKPRSRQAMSFVSGYRTAGQSTALAAVETPAATNNMLTPLGYYEAYELVVVLSPRLSDLEKEEYLGSLESLFTEYQCKKVEKLDRSRRLLAYPIKENIEAYVILYTFKGPRTMPKAVIDWFTAPGNNSEDAILRCNIRKQRRVKKGEKSTAPGEEELPMWNI